MRIHPANVRRAPQKHCKNKGFGTHSPLNLGGGSSPGGLQGFWPETPGGGPTEAGFGSRPGGCKWRPHVRDNYDHRSREGLEALGTPKTRATMWPSHGQILAAKLPKLWFVNFDVDFWGEFIPPVFSAEAPPPQTKKKTPKTPPYNNTFPRKFLRKNSPRILQKPSLDSDSESSLEHLASAGTSL